MLDRLGKLMTVSHWVRTFAAMLSLYAAPAFAAQVSFTKDTQLRAEPRFDSASVVAVRPGMIGDVTQKQGPWLQVYVEGKPGWVLTTDIIYGVAQPQITSTRSSLFGTSRVSTTTSTIGIRICFGEELHTLSSAVNEEQLSLLDRYAVSKEDAYTQHAKPLGLEPRQIPLP